MPYFQSMIDRKGKFAGFLKAQTRSQLTIKVATAKPYRPFGKTIKANIAEDYKGRQALKMRMDKERKQKRKQQKGYSI